MKVIKLGCLKITIGEETPSISEQVKDPAWRRRIEELANAGKVETPDTSGFVRYPTAGVGAWISQQGFLEDMREEARRLGNWRPDPW